MDPAFEAAAFAMKKPGELSEPGKKPIRLSSDSFRRPKDAQPSPSNRPFA
jgi:hypothetical protein